MSKNDSSPTIASCAPRIQRMLGLWSRSTIPVRSMCAADIVLRMPRVPAAKPGHDSDATPSPGWLSSPVFVDSIDSTQRSSRPSSKPGAT
jgi:hypothetical protein